MRFTPKRSLMGETPTRIEAIMLWADHYAEQVHLVYPQDETSVLGAAFIASCTSRPVRTIDLHVLPATKEGFLSL